MSHWAETQIEDEDDDEDEDDLVLGGGDLCGLSDCGPWLAS